MQSFGKDINGAQFRPAVVGASVTEISRTDRWVYTVIGVSPDGNTATLQLNRDVGFDADPNDSDAFNAQWAIIGSKRGQYDTEPNPRGPIVEVSMTVDGWRGMRGLGNTFLMGVADAYMG
jgi:hypothetical protein